MLVARKLFALNRTQVQQVDLFLRSVVQSHPYSVTAYPKISNSFKLGTIRSVIGIENLRFSVGASLRFYSESSVTLMIISNNSVKFDGNPR